MYGIGNISRTLNDVLRPCNGLGRLNPYHIFNVDFDKSDPRYLELAAYSLKLNEDHGTPIEIKKDVSDTLRQMSDWHIVPGDIWKPNDEKIISTLIDQINDEYFADKQHIIKPIQDNPIKPTPYKTELKLMSRRFNRWSRNQVLWGKFVDALKKLIDPKDLISKTFKTVVVYPVNDDVKSFENIAQALDYAFDKGYRNKRNWLIINDKNKTVLTDSSIPNTLQGIIEGLYGVPSDSLGKPTIKLEFEDNAQLADFLKDNQPHYQYAQYTDVTASDVSPNSATDAKANTRTNGKLMPAADSRTLPESPTASALPPTKTPPTLPPAPTAKALPEHVEEKELSKYNTQIENYYIAKKKYPDHIIIFSYLGVGVSILDDATIVSIALDLPINGSPEKPFTQISDKTNGIIKAAKKLQSLGYNVVVFNINMKPILVLDAKEATNEPPVVKFTPKKPKQKEPEIEFDNVTYITRGMPAIIMDVPQSSISSKTYLNDWWNFVERKYHYPDDIVTFVQIEDKDNGTHYSKYYQFFFKNRDKDFVLRNIRNKKNVIFKDDFFIVTKLADIERIEDALLDDGNRHLVIIKPLIYDDGLGKPTIKLEFEDNADLMHLFDTDGISGLTVNDKPAAVFNCPESQLDCRGYKPTYKRLADYSHLIDAADGAKTLKGYGFEKSTLDELVNACKQYKQVERLAAHLKDDDQMQSAFNIWHWLHTNIKYDYDTPGEEEIRTPARVWADRKSGVDCDCLAVFTACLLLNMGYQPKFEIVAFNNSPKFSHIYVNLDGAAIDRVLPVFLARPQNITKTKIMEIPVYELSGVGRCASLSGVYSSTLQKIQSGAASGDDNNNFRKMQVIVTLKGIDTAAAKLATVLMPYVSTIGDDGIYYFDSSKIAALAKKYDAQLKTLKIQGADDAMIDNWISQVASELQTESNNATADGDDTIIVIINPKGDYTNVQGRMVASDTQQTLSPLTKDAVAMSNAAVSKTMPAVMATNDAPTMLTTEPETESTKDNNTLLWLLCGIFGGLGIAAMSKTKKKTR